MTDASDFVLGVDLDGVCGDYTAGVPDVVADRAGRRPESSLTTER